MGSTIIIVPSNIYIVVVLLICSTDIHVIAAIRAKEDYESLADEFRDIFAAINFYLDDPAITINGNTYTLDFFCVQITRCVP